MSTFGDPRLPLKFWTKVAADDAGCWIWIACTNSKGYGQFAVNQVSKSVHRLSYLALVGPIPEGLTIDHLCRVKTCVNPHHLEVVSVAENVRRAKRFFRTGSIHPSAAEQRRLAALIKSA